MIDRDQLIEQIRQAPFPKDSIERLIRLARQGDQQGLQTVKAILDKYAPAIQGITDQITPEAVQGYKRSLKTINHFLIKTHQTIAQQHEEDELSALEKAINNL